MVICRFEPLSYLLLHGLPDLAYEMWVESEVKHKHAVYGPDWEAYQALQDKDILRFIAMREDGNLIGYVSIVIETYTQQADLLMASFRDIFVAASKRGYAAKLVRFAERQLSELGVKRVLGGARTERQQKFWMALDYAPQETILGKTIN